MKIRQGFVSNSSSSSFLLYGAYTTKDKLVELLEKNADFKERLEEYEGQVAEFVEYRLLKDTKLEVQTPRYEEDVYIGLSWDEVGDEETGKQFKERVEVTLKERLGEELFKELKFGTYSEAWYDG